MLGGYGVSALLKMGGDCPRLPWVVRTPNRSFACGLHAVPRENSVVYLGATNAITIERRRHPSVGELQFLLQSGCYQLRRDFNAAELVTIQSGHRPASIDGYPMFGSCSVPGLWFLTGTYRDGLHLSPLLAKDIARRLLGLAGLVDYSIFSPEREPIQALSREDTLTEVVKHSLATGFEFGWRLSPEWPEYIRGMLRSSYSGLAAELSEFYTPPPELLAVLQFSDEKTRSRIREFYSCAYATWH